MNELESKDYYVCANLPPQGNDGRLAMPFTPTTQGVLSFRASPRYRDRGIGLPVRSQTRRRYHVQSCVRRLALMNVALYGQDENGELRPIQIKPDLLAKSRLVRREEVSHQ